MQFPLESLPGTSLPLRPKQGRQPRRVASGSERVLTGKLLQKVRKEVKVASFGAQADMCFPFLFIPASSMVVQQFEVKAKENSVVGGIALDTGIVVAKGDRLIIKAPEDDTWACGALADLTSNANGLAAGNKYGGVYGTMPSPTTGAQFPYGSLVGSLDGGKSHFLVGTQFDAPVPQAGTLSLCYWDGNSEDNTGFVTVTVETLTNGSPVSFNPAGTRWSVAAMDKNGNVGGFHPTPWEFQAQSMKAGTLWVGSYKLIQGSNNKYACEIMPPGSNKVSDSFDVEFVTADRFIATKAGAPYRSGKKI